LQPQQAALLAKFEALLPSRNAQLAPELVPMNDLLRKHRGIPRDPAEKQAFWQGADTYNRRWLLCPFNDERGYCGIYPVRPLPCRVTYVADTADNCGPKATTSPALIKHPALDQAIKDARELLLAAVDRAARPAEKEMIGMVGDALNALRTPKSPA
jgi:Fe-S-cluster containining protein